MRLPGLRVLSHHGSGGARDGGRPAVFLDYLAEGLEDLDPLTELDVLLVYGVQLVVAVINLA